MVKIIKLTKKEKKRITDAQRLAKGNVKVKRVGHFGVKISGGWRGDKPITVNIQAPLKTIVSARNKLYKLSKKVKRKK